MKVYAILELGTGWADEDYFYEGSNLNSLLKNKEEAEKLAFEANLKFMDNMENWYWYTVVQNEKEFIRISGLSKDELSDYDWYTKIAQLPREVKIQLMPHMRLPFSVEEREVF